MTEKDGKRNLGETIRGLIKILNEADREQEPEDVEIENEMYDSYTIEIPGKLAQCFRDIYELIAPVDLEDRELPGKTFDDLVLVCLDAGMKAFLTDSLARLLAAKVSHQIEERLREDMRSGNVDFERLKDVRIEVVDKDNLMEILGGISDGLRNSPDEKPEGDREVHTQDGYC